MRLQFKWCKIHKATRPVPSIWMKASYPSLLPLAFSTAERLSNSWLDVRHIEKYVDQGKSGTRELLWSWAQKNKTIGDLLQVLQEMGHQRAIHLITNYGECVLRLWLSVRPMGLVISDSDIGLSCCQWPVACELDTLFPQCQYKTFLSTVFAFIFETGTPYITLTDLELDM